MVIAFILRMRQQVLRGDVTGVWLIGSSAST